MLPANPPPLIIEADAPEPLPDDPTQPNPAHPKDAEAVALAQPLIDEFMGRFRHGIARLLEGERPRPAGDDGPGPDDANSEWDSLACASRRDGGK